MFCFRFRRFFDRRSSLFINLMNRRGKAMRRYQQDRGDNEKQNERSIHREVLRKTAWSSFANAVIRMSAVIPSEFGVMNQTAVVSPTGKRADNVLPIS